MAFIAPNFIKLINASTALCRALLTDLHIVAQENGKYRQKVIYALKKVMGVTELILTKSRLAQQLSVNNEYTEYY
jgi:hypothetical protein